jgi:hypothetical protein
VYHFEIVVYFFILSDVRIFNSSILAALSPQRPKTSQTSILPIRSLYFQTSDNTKRSVPLEEKVITQSLTLTFSTTYISHFSALYLYKASG